MAISLAYLVGVSALMIWRGISVSPDYLLLVLVPIALLSGRFLGFLRDWVPFIALFLGYEAMRGIAPRTGISPQVGSMAGIESTLFAGQNPTAFLQQHVGTPTWLAVVCTVVYFCHFILPVTVGMVLWLVDRAQFLRFVSALLGMSFAAFIIFLLVPTAPPWIAHDQGLIPGMHKLISDALPSAVSPYYQTLNPNPVAAFPSLHAAFPFLGALALWNINRRAAYVTLGWCLVVWFSVIYLGEHYLIDVYAGIAFAGLSWLVMQKLIVPRVGALQHHLVRTPHLPGEEPIAAAEPIESAVA